MICLCIMLDVCCDQSYSVNLCCLCVVTIVCCELMICCEPMCCYYCSMDLCVTWLSHMFNLFMCHGRCFAQAPVIQVMRR